MQAKAKEELAAAETALAAARSTMCPLLAIPNSVLLLFSTTITPGGKGSVARPCIDVPANAEFTVPVDLRLVRPVQQGAGPLVRVQLDGVLFDDLGFFGPNKLNVQRGPRTVSLDE